jgi:CRP-like cAMP-binding protein
MREKYWHLVNRPLLTALQAEILRDLEQQCRIRTYAPGSGLAHPSQPPGGILLVLDGEVKLINTTPLATDSTIAVLEAGDIAGELPEDGIPVYDDFLVASQETTIAHLPAAAAQALFAADSGTGIAIKKRLGLTRFRIDLPWSRLVFRSTEQRLTRLFENLRARLGYQLPDYSTDLGVRLTLNELSRIVGSSTGSVRRVLKDMESRREVRYARSRVILTSRRAA